MEEGLSKQGSLSKHWLLSKRKTGTFGEYRIKGHQFKSPTGEVGWHITAGNQHGLAEDYWVSGKTFHALNIQYLHKMNHRMVLEVFDDITSLISSAKKEAVLRAIAEWETASSQHP